MPRFKRIPPDIPGSRWEIGDDEPLLQGVVTPLHASKRSNEIYTQCYIDTYDLKVACFRLSGIYGPYQFGGEDHGWWPILPSARSSASP